MSEIKYTKEALEKAVKNSTSISDVLRYFGGMKSGSSHNRISKKVKEFEIDTSHFYRTYNYNLSQNVKIDFSLVLVNNRLDGRRENSGRLRRALIESGVEHKCSNCGNCGEWQGEKLTLEIDHIDEDRVNNLQTNLRFLCPNCHSLRGNNVPNRIKICKNCSKEYSSKNKEFCSFKCSYKKDKTDHTGKQCSFCKKEYNNQNTTYCSNKCYKKGEEEKSLIPTKEGLIESFRQLKSFVQVGKKYNVSDNAVRKWCRKYGVLEKVKIGGRS